MYSTYDTYIKSKPANVPPFAVRSSASNVTVTLSTTWTKMYLCTYILTDVSWGGGGRSKTREHKAHAVALQRCAVLKVSLQPHQPINASIPSRQATHYTPGAQNTSQQYACAPPPKAGYALHAGVHIHPARSPRQEILLATPTIPKKIKEKKKRKKKRDPSCLLC